MLTVATTRTALRTWDPAVDRMLRQGDLELRRIDRDALVAGRTHVRLRQVHDGVPIVGSELVRQLDQDGLTVSIFGTTYAVPDVDVTPTLTIEDAAAIVRQHSGIEPVGERQPALCLFPVESGLRLAYRASVFSPAGGVEYVVDARDGRLLQESESSQRQAAIGGGTGVLGDTKKMSVTAGSGVFTATDALRPPSLVTYDMRENLQRTLDVLNGRASLGPADLAGDTDNTWDDPAAVDAHAHSGYFYDFYYKRFGRRGLDDNNFRMRSLVHPVARSAVLSQPVNVVGLFYLNAFYAGAGVMVYGEGLPGNLSAGGQHWDYLSGGLDVVAHELTHGVTDYTSALVYRDEPGALNESFSDMMATAAEFFFQEPGSGPLKADYLVAEDIVTPGGIRSMADPSAYGQPDHYTRRAILPLSRDNGGVHVNSGIPNHAYYLAIEGGTNRTSGLSVQGVGLPNREQIEKAMYRAFTQLMPPTATFSLARAATIQAATDLYGAASPAVRALRQAWTAVGVE